MAKQQQPLIEIDRLECGSAGSSGGSAFGRDGLTEIRVDGKPWGFVRWSEGRRFSIEWDDGRGHHDLGWRKNRDTAARAALAAVRKILSS